jgi:cell division protein FtsQ
MAEDERDGSRARAGRPTEWAPGQAPAGQAPPGRTSAGQARAGSARAGQAAPERAAGRGTGQTVAPVPARRGRLRTRWRAAFFALAALAILAGVAWALLGSRFFIVRSVKVAGTGPLVHRERVLTAARIPLGVPLVRVNGAAVARRVEEIRQVQSAHVSVDWPGTVVISVRPRTPVFAIAGPRGYALVDAFGVDVRDTARQPRDVPLLTLHGVTTTNEAVTMLESLRGSPAVRAAALVLRELPARIARRVTAVTTSGPAETSVRLEDGVTIVWGGTGNATAKATELRVLMRQPAAFYDVSSPATAVTRG